MGTYNLPRNVKGEGRILFIFTTKSLIYATVGAGVGLIFYLIFTLFFRFFVIRKTYYVSKFHNMFSNINVIFILSFLFLHQVLSYT